MTDLKTMPAAEKSKRRTRAAEGRVEVARVAKKQEVVVHKPQPPVQPKTLLEVIADVAMNPAIDVTKMQAIVNLKMELDAKEAERARTAAFNALQAELPIIDKNNVIDHGEGVTARGNKKLKTRFADYPHLMEVVGPLLRKHGFTFSSVIEPTADGTGILVVSYLDHIGGAPSKISRRPMTLDTTGGKNSQQGAGSSQSYGMRYNLIAMLNIVSRAPQDADRDGFTKKDDPISTGPQLIDQDALLQLRDAIEASGVPLEKFCEKYGIDQPANLPAAKYKDALTACENYRKAKADGKNA